MNTDDVLNLEDDGDLFDFDFDDEDLLDDFDEDEESGDAPNQLSSNEEEDALGSLFDSEDEGLLDDFDDEGLYSDSTPNLTENNNQNNHLSDNFGREEKGSSEKEVRGGVVNAIGNEVSDLSTSSSSFSPTQNTQKSGSEKLVVENNKISSQLENGILSSIPSEIFEDTRNSGLEEFEMDLDMTDFEDSELQLSDREKAIMEGRADAVEGADEYGVDIEETGSPTDDEEVYTSVIEKSVIKTPQVEEGNFEVVYAEFSNIAIPSVRIRTDRSVDALYQSINSTGLLRPIEVAMSDIEGVYILVDGYKRIIACARAGFKKIPCLVNRSIKSSNIPILEAIHNQHSAYTIEEQIKYIEYLEKERGIMSASMIEALLQMNSGDYAKLKDILEDNDDEIVAKLYEGTFDIGSAYRALEKRRKGESRKEKELKQTAKMYADETSDIINDSGEVSEGTELTEEELSEIAVNPAELDNDLDNAELEDMVAEGDAIQGFEKHKQDVNKREYIDPSIKKAVLARDNYTCQACKRGGEAYVDVLDFHHILPVFLGGVDSKDNGICLCLTCHKMVHLYSFGDLSIPAKKSEEEIANLDEENRVIYNDERLKYKRIVKLGTVIRKGMEARHIKRDQAKKEHPIDRVGRRVPGGEQEAY